MPDRAPRTGWHQTQLPIGRGEAEEEPCRKGDLRVLVSSSSSVCISSAFCDSPEPKSHPGEHHTQHHQPAKRHGYPDYSVLVQPQPKHWVLYWAPPFKEAVKVLDCSQRKIIKLVIGLVRSGWGLWACVGWRKGVRVVISLLSTAPCRGKGGRWWALLPGIQW